MVPTIISFSATDDFPKRMMWCIVVVVLVCFDSWAFTFHPPTHSLTSQQCGQLDSAGEEACVQNCASETRRWTPWSFPATFVYLSRSMKLGFIFINKKNMSREHLSVMSATTQIVARTRLKCTPALNTEVRNSIASCVILNATIRLVWTIIIMQCIIQLMMKLSNVQSVNGVGKGIP